MTQVAQFVSNHISLEKALKRKLCLGVFNSKMLDTKTCECITKLVEKLATSGKHQIDKIVFREFVSHAG